jgi:origin recognition complex subunit 2
MTNGTLTLNGKKLFSTPVKVNGTSEANETPRLARNADRSARRKSTRALIERTVLGNTSDNDEEEEDIAQHIYESEEEDEIEVEATNAPDTPSKRGRRKGTKTRRRSPTPPPQDLPPHEKYFFQNRGGRPKTSDNNLSSLTLLDHEEYFSLSRNSKDPQTDDIKALQDLHAKSFNQWQFELSQDFNICVYGWGSKRALLMRFADHTYKSQAATKPKIVVVNGYVHNLTIRDVLNTIAAAVSAPGQKMGSQPAEMLENLVALLEEDKSQDITVIVHSIDRAPLRRPTTQAILSRLSAHPQIHLVASADHPSFPLLWDSSLRSTYNFLFHDCTTFQPYVAEVDVVDVVHELLGRSGRRVGGKEGVSFVLKSLPENAKNLFRVLIGEQLVAMDGSYGDTLGGVDDDDNDDNERRTGNSRKTEPGVE